MKVKTLTPSTLLKTNRTKNKQTNKQYETNMPKSTAHTKQEIVPVILSVPTQHHMHRLDPVFDCSVSRCW